MEFFIIFGVTAYIAFIVWLVIWMQNRWKKLHAESQHKISDAEIFKLMTQANHFLTPDQLAEISSLTKKEAKGRLMHLSIQKVIRRYYDASGRNAQVYQLKEEVPLINSLRSNVNKLSDEDIVNIIMMHVDDYQVTIAELVVIFGIDIYEAKALIKRLKKNGVLTVLRSSLGHIYAIRKPIQHKTPQLRTTPKKSDLGKMKIPESEKIKIPDADVIALALQNNGRVTPTMLCLDKKIPINEAKLKLEALYEQGAFVMDVDESNYVMEYHLRDKSLL